MHFMMFSVLEKLVFRAGELLFFFATLRNQQRWDSLGDLYGGDCPLSCVAVVVRYCSCRRWMIFG